MTVNGATGVNDDYLQMIILMYVEKVLKILKTYKFKSLDFWFAISIVLKIVYPNSSNKSHPQLIGCFK